MKNLTGAPLLIYLHIGKAGGSTLHGILEKQYEGVGHFFTGGGPGENDIERIKGFTKEEKEAIGVVRGHINYGVHELFPGPHVYITVLREPVDRVVSHYYYVRRDPGHYLHEKCIRDWSLNDFIFQTSDNDNGQTRALAGVQEFYSFRKSLVPFGECNEGHLETAKRNLKGFAAVGLTERFDESVILFKRVLGWASPPLFTKRNVTGGRVRKDDVPEETVRLIREHNRLDIELYEYSKGLFEAQVAREGATFEVELDYFRLMNKVYQEKQVLLKEFGELSDVIEAMRKSNSWRLTAPFRRVKNLFSRTWR